MVPLIKLDLLFSLYLFFIISILLSFEFGSKNFQRFAPRLERIISYWAAVIHRGLYPSTSAKIKLWSSKTSTSKLLGRTWAKKNRQIKRKFHKQEYEWKRIGVPIENENKKKWKYSSKLLIRLRLVRHPKDSDKTSESKEWEYISIMHTVFCVSSSATLFYFIWQIEEKIRRGGVVEHTNTISFWRRELTRMKEK